MKFTCNQSNLLKVLSIVSRALGSRQFPILENILITVNPAVKTITCAATNLEIAIKATTSAEIVPAPNHENLVCLPGKQLTDIVRSFTAGKIVEVITNETGAAIKCGKSNFKVPVMPVNEFPKIKEPDGSSFTVSTEAFLEAVKRVIYVPDIKDTRPFAQSVFFDIEPGKLNLVARDGLPSRLVIQTLPIEDNLNSQVLIPANSLKKIIDIAVGSEIQFHITNSQLFAVFDDSFISAGLVNSQYPSYQPVISFNFPGQMILKRNEFAQILERATLVDLQARLQIVTAGCNSSTKSLNIFVDKLGESSQFEEEAEILEQSGTPDFNDGFNVRFLLEFLKSIDSETVELNYIGFKKPVLLKGCDDESCKYFGMPLILPQKQSTPVAADIRQAS